MEDLSLKNHISCITLAVLKTEVLACSFTIFTAVTPVLEKHPQSNTTASL